MSGAASRSGDWRRMDRETLSRAYDNTGAVADSAARLSGWRARSAELRALHPHDLDLPYGPAERNRIDLFRSGAEDAPLLVFIHGGYWIRNARQDFACMAEGPLNHGLDVGLVGYTLAPAASLTEIAAEIRAALAVLRGREEGRGRRRLVVSGWSAGGHLAALALAWPEVDAGLAISGVFDLEPIRHTELDDRLHLTEAEIEALSPIRQVPRSDKPLAVVCGSAELPELRRHSADYDEAWRSAGNASTFAELPGHDHFSILDELIRPDGALTALAVKLAGKGA
ncbi:alpha/beta hydrolase [Methylobacterium sp. E-045]|uniref:alpha/beta hydrolase n=1 Tax=Methylobacterium sp. E-045 TaxID=2836575 RepID=UPI001FBA0B3A|nr:alpha/beta hydrolase [Methylobacterium sp. E-045]MCJ2129734.1 alpha/beta hydrolase [Methylobacterium sp. E-045]